MSDFPWGQVLVEHRISGFTIIEHHPWKVRGVTLQTGKPDLTKREFHIQGQSRTFDTLDGALIGAICYRYDGCNERLSGYVIKALGIGAKKEA